MKLQKSVLWSLLVVGSLSVIVGCDKPSAAPAKAPASAPADAPTANTTDSK
jgi:hypothetical protein